jgi:uncharacterized membrane protein
MIFYSLQLETFSPLCLLLYLFANRTFNFNYDEYMTNHFKINYKIGWHLILVHFPISLYGVGFLFQILHKIFSPDAFTLATSVVILCGSIVMIPTTISGWFTWKRKYKGANTFLFRRKIITSFVMLWISVILTTWRFLAYNIFLNEPDPYADWIFMFGTFLLISGSVLEGYYGGRLTHRD